MKLNLKERIKRPLFWVSVLLITSVVFGFVYKFTGMQWSYYAAIGPWGLLIPFAVVGIVFAWIINPIRSLIQKRKDKKKKEE